MLIMLIDDDLGSLVDTKAALNPLLPPPVPGGENDILMCKDVREVLSVGLSHKEIDLIIFDLIWYSIEKGLLLRDILEKPQLINIPKIVFTKYAWKIAEAHDEKVRYSIIQFYESLLSRTDILGVVSKPKEGGMPEGIHNLASVTKEFIKLKNIMKIVSNEQLKFEITKYIEGNKYDK